MGRYAEGSDARAIDATIQAMFSAAMSSARWKVRRYLGGIDGIVDVIFTMFGLLALAMAGLIMFNTFRTSVVERRRDIGMLRAVGARRKSVDAHYSV